MLKRRIETIKFGEFMGGEYKNKAEKKETILRPVLKVAQYGAIYTIAAKVALPAMVIAIPIALIVKTLPAMAATTTAVTVATQAPVVVPVSIVSEAVKEKIVHAFDPLVDLMVGLSIPIAGVMVTGGALLVLIGQKDGGFKLIMNAALGYILVQLSPMFIDLLIGIGKAV